MTRTSTALAATLLFFTVGAAHAESWTNSSVSYDYATVHSASVLASDGQFALVVECEQNGPFNIWVESPLDWEPDASYAPDVPTTFVVDGSEISDVVFQFDFRQLGEGIAAFRKDQVAAFDRLFSYLGSATESISLRYFDKVAAFPADGARAAMLALTKNCAG